MNKLSGAVIKGYLDVLRPHQWYKNFVTVFGFIYALVYLNVAFELRTTLSFALATLLACLISSANYAVNEITDKVGDSYHPLKKNRSVVTGRVSVNSLKMIIAILVIGTLSISLIFFTFGITFALTLLFIAGIFYNIPPLRFKDIAFVDVISESINNPIRFLIGWFSVATYPIYPAISLLALFLFSGMVLMTYKRYKELSYIINHHNEVVPSKYRKSYCVYTVQSLMFMTIVSMLATICFFVYLFKNHFFI